jgi:hypothetical protein
MSNPKQSENNLLLDLIEEELDEDHLIVSKKESKEITEANVSNINSEVDDNFKLIAASFHQNTGLDSITKVDREDFFHQVSSYSVRFR